MIFWIVGMTEKVNGGHMGMHYFLCHLQWKGLKVIWIHVQF